MSLAQVLSTVIALNLMVTAAFLILRLVHFLEREPNQISARSVLRLHYATLVLIALLTVAHPFLPRGQVFRPAAKVWSADSMKSFSQHYFPTSPGYLLLPTGQGAYPLKVEILSESLLGIALALSFFSLAAMTREIWLLSRLRQRAYRSRRLGKVALFLSDEITVPFSSWLPGKVEVFLPTSLLSKPHNFRIAVAHEIQHHRQRDTRWIYGMWALKIFCAANPFSHLWMRWLSELQEFACDETLVDQHKVESRQYARCLIEVAETASNQKYAPACATGLVFLVERNLLKRRIEKMIQPTKTRTLRLSASLVVLALTTSVALASSGVIQDRRVSWAQAEKYAARARRDSQFPIVVNDLVLKQLNRYIGTPEGREFMKLSLQRMENYRTLVESKLAEYQVPVELAAIPVTESGYQNLPSNNQKGYGAGVWMFLASTARNFGLTVTESLDERLNVELETDAAMRYLKGEALRLRDWPLSVLAYNMGGNAVNEAIRKTGSRDAWELVRAGFENDRDYLPAVMAAIIIMKNPESLS